MNISIPPVAQLLDFLSIVFWRAASHPTEAIAWALGSIALVKTVHVAGVKIFGRNVARLTAELNRTVNALSGEALTAIGTTIPEDNEDRELVELHEALLPGYRGSRSTLAKFGNLLFAAIPGGRNRNQRRQFDAELLELLDQFSSTPSSSKAELARNVVEAVVGNINDYINEGASPIQIISAAKKRYVAAGRKRRSTKRVANAMHVIADRAVALAAEARGRMGNLHQALTVVGDPDRLNRLVELLNRSESLVALSDDADCVLKLVEELGGRSGSSSRPDGRQLNGGLAATRTGNSGNGKSVAKVG